MKLRNLNEVNEFKKIMDNARGDVWAEDREGMKYDLKSELDQFVVIGEMLKNPDHDLELYASDAKDEWALIEYLMRLKCGAA